MGPAAPAAAGAQTAAGRGSVSYCGAEWARDAVGRLYSKGRVPFQLKTPAGVGVRDGVVGAGSIGVEHS